LRHVDVLFGLTCPAIAFAYFEALLRVGDGNKLQEEEARLNSMGNLLEHIGYSRDIWIDFADEAFELLRKLASSLHNVDGAAADILLQSFNDMGVSMAIITYFKASSVCPLFRGDYVDRYSFLPALGSNLMQMTLDISSPWAMSRHTAPTT
jgi:hypothetical protein